MEGIEVVIKKENVEIAEKDSEVLHPTCIEMKEILKTQKQINQTIFENPNWQILYHSWSVERDLEVCRPFEFRPKKFPIGNWKDIASQKNRGEYFSQILRCFSKYFSFTKPVLLHGNTTGC